MLQQRLLFVSYMKKKYPGQALITLLFYVLIVVTISSAAVILIIINSRSATSLQQGDIAYYIAESGAENAFLRLFQQKQLFSQTIAKI